MTTESRCAHFLVCGGCKHQNISYSEQLKVKEVELKSLFEPFLSHSPDLLAPIMGTQDPWRYRNKMEFSFSQDKEGNRFLGLYRARGRNRVENLNECHLVPQWFSQALGMIRTWWEERNLKAYHPYKNEGHLRTLTLRQGMYTGEKMAFLTVSGNPQDALSKKDIESFRQVFTALDPTISLFLKIHLAIKGQPTQFFEHHLNGKDHIKEILTIGTKSFTFKISPSAFFQPNPMQAQLLFEQALTLLQPKPDDFLLDLYCGIGTLSVLFASQVRKVVGIEINPYAIYDAKENALWNNLSNIDFFCDDVATFLTQKGLSQKPDCLIVDPPRAGLDPKTQAAILEMEPKKILYISCNPKTQAEDLAVLTKSYTLEALQPVDQFPHTPHVENIALLKKSKIN
jgi:23S rRNA (uracil-5-)-methyltransferase RumA